MTGDDTLHAINLRLDGAIKKRDNLLTWSYIFLDMEGFLHQQWRYFTTIGDRANAETTLATKQEYRQKIDANADKLDYLIDVLIPRLEAQQSAEYERLDEQRRLASQRIPEELQDSDPDREVFAAVQSHNLDLQIMTAGLIEIEVSPNFLSMDADISLDEIAKEDGDDGKFVVLTGVEKSMPTAQAGVVIYLKVTVLRLISPKERLYSKYLFKWDGAVQIITYPTLPAIDIYSKYLFIWHGRFQRSDENSGSSSFKERVYDAVRGGRKMCDLAEVGGRTRHSGRPPGGRQDGSVSV